jgi:sugar/nucleoside kinase (ribokinase family)
MGAVGRDGYGRFAHHSLRVEGVDTSFIVTSEEAFTSVVLALVDRQGERTLLGWPRRGAAHTQLLAGQVEAEVITGMAWLHTTGMCLVESPVREAILHGMALAQTAGIPVSFDLNLRLGLEDGRLPGEFEQTLRQAIALANYVFGSADDELAYLAPAASAAESARQLAGDRRTVIARLGAAGVVAVSAQQVISMPAFPAKVVDTVGAGDAFNAGFIAAQLQGQGLTSALRWGNTVAALKIGRPGARGVPYRAEVEVFLNTALNYYYNDT